MWAGKTIINSDPFPNSETTFISPPKESTIYLQIAKPTPVPLYFSLVCNLLKIENIVS